MNKSSKESRQIIWIQYPLLKVELNICLHLICLPKIWACNSHTLGTSMAKSSAISYVEPNLKDN